ncbi:MAG: leucine-rich repeat domain-containing protein [Prevotella sp.]|nr:leucine-rich repeat domain-containing protein [Prevotella sp.]
MTLQDSCFADCPNLEYVDMLYLRTDGSNIAEPLTPAMLQLGSSVFENSPKVRFKMTDRQMEWFAADTTWAKYKDRFLPALFLPADPVVVSKLSDLKYRTDVARSWYDNNASKWGDWLDVTRATSDNYLNGKFSGNENLRSFPDFKRFELIGLDYVGGSWFVSCSNLNAIDLPSTIKHIGGWAFYGCSSLKEITIPAAVETIDASAFEYSGLKTVRCEGMKPATLCSNAFNLTSFSGFTIYVPAEAVDAYKKAWPSLAQYIKSNAEDRRITVVDVREPGKLAEKLGLTTIMSGDRLRNVGGAYWKYDSLTVRSHLNGLDVGVLRHLMGADAWDSDPTNGRLRYLDLHNAHFDQDTKYSYNLYGVDEYLEKANWVGEYMFQNCTALETLILPASVTEIGENAFERATNLKHLFVGQRLEKYTRDLIQDIPGGLDELVLMTDSFATSESEDPWEGPISMVYTKKSLLGDYMSDPALTNRAQGITAPFEDEEVMRILAVRRCYFPSQYLNVESTKNPFGSYLDGDGYFFYRDKDLKTFDEFRLFSNVRELDYDFQNCSGLERITLPASIEHIGFDAFTGCAKLASIHISADSVPVLDHDAFRDLPADFQIIVPKTHVKRYREQWAQYADHIVGEDEDFRSDIIEVTLTEPNTLAQHLGLQYTYEAFKETWYEKPLKKYRVTSVTGDYSHIRGLKVNGPISSADFMVMRFLAGFDIVKDRRNATSLGNARNYLAQLEYIDLYDADIVCTDFSYPNSDGEVETKAFCRCYALKTLILPRTATYVAERAFQECENLQTLVIGDEYEKFLWSSLDDCASMTRMYILSKKKMEMTDENWLRRNLSNNYNPTFDAVYVRPSLYQEYLADEAYVGPDHRTNSVSTGAFKDDESFAAFAAHAAATKDDLRLIGDISGWFRHHTGVIDFDALQYTSIDSLRTADVAPLTQLRSVTLPATVKGVGKDAFKNGTGLSYVDMSKCAEYDPTLAAEGGVRSLGIGENTLAYVPVGYALSGSPAETNVAVGSDAGFHAQTFRLVDGEDYCVPFAVTADKVENTRTLAKSAAPYTVCLPYDLDIPDGSKVYRLSGRGTNELIFAQHTGRMEAMQPYLVWTESADALLSTANVTLLSSNDGNTVGSQQQSVGYTLRGTLNSIGNQEAVELGAYVMNDDAKWHPVLSDTDEHRAVTIPAFRCFLLQSRKNGSRAIGMTLEDADGIVQLRTVDSDGTERVYDLSGRRIDGNAKGIVIKNGRKTINQ